MTNLEVFQTFKTLYLAESGLCRLDPYPLDSQVIALDPGQVESCNNENGILFLAYMVARLDEAKMYIEIQSLKAQIRMTIETLQCRPGLYDRQPGGARGRTEAHDNYVGITYLCAYFNWPDLVQEIIDWAWSHAFCFNNVAPETFDLKQLRQPGEIALYYFAKYTRPNLFFSACMAGGLVINATKDDAGQKQLVWLRLKTIDLTSVEPNFILRAAITAWQESFRDGFYKGDIANVFAEYFRANHPIRLLQVQA